MLIEYDVSGQVRNCGVASFREEFGADMTREGELVRNWFLRLNLELSGVRLSGTGRRVGNSDG